MHTPGSLFGSREEAYGADDTEWLRLIAGTGWAVIGRDAKIAVRPYEFLAYRKAKVHMFLLPGEATKQELVDLLSKNLKVICTAAVSRPVDIWKVGAAGLRHTPTELALFGLGGLVIAVVGAPMPAGWAARTRTATALRTE